MLLGIVCCSQSLAVMAEDEAVKEYTTPPAAETVPPPDRIPSLVPQSVPSSPASQSTPPTSVKPVPAASVPCPALNAPRKTECLIQFTGGAFFVVMFFGTLSKNKQGIMIAKAQVIAI